MTLYSSYPGILRPTLYDSTNPNGSLMNVSISMPSNFKTQFNYPAFTGLSGLARWSLLPRSHPQKKLLHVTCYRSMLSLTLIPPYQHDIFGSDDPSDIWNRLFKKSPESILQSPRILAFDVTGQRPYN